MKKSPLTRMATMTAVGLLALAAGLTAYSGAVQQAPVGIALLGALLVAVLTAGVCVSVVWFPLQVYRDRSRAQFATACLIATASAALGAFMGYTGIAPESQLPQSLRVLLVPITTAGFFTIPFLFVLEGRALFIPHGQKVLPVLATMLAIAAPAAYVAALDINSPASVMLLAYAMLWAFSWWAPPFMPRRKTGNEPAVGVLQEQ